jgi:hypothetical protein
MTSASSPRPVSALRARMIEDMTVRAFTYSGKVIPKSLDDRLIYLLRSTRRWQDWPLDQIVPSRALFLDFLHERWPIFVRQKLDGQAGGVREGPEPYDERTRLRGRGARVVVGAISTRVMSGRA